MPVTYEKGIQPEMVYYYSHIIEFKANWDATQDWNVTAVPLDKQKPDELKKQKPDENIEGTKTGHGMAPNRTLRAHNPDEIPTMSQKPITKKY